ncbi:MAG: O-antigen ligase family protein [Candidatus Desantisbacteria bacterium]
MKFLILFLVITFLSPNIISPFRIEDMVLLFLALQFIAVHIIKKKPIILSIMPLNVFLLLFISFFLSLLSGSILSSGEITIRDFAYIFQTIKYFLVYSISYYLYDKSKCSIEVVFIAITWIGLVSGMIALAQYFNFFDVNSWLTNIYIDNEFYLSQLQNESFLRRTVGTSFNSNHFGFLIGLPILSGLILCINYKKYMYYGIVAVLVGSLITTLSRTSVLIVAFYIILLFFSMVVRKRRKSLLLPICFFFVFLGGAVFTWQLKNMDENSPLYKRVEPTTQLVLTQENSITKRLDMWANSIDYIISHTGAIIFGLGPQKATMSTVTDNEYISTLRKSGVFGIFLIVCIELFIVISSLKYLVFDKSLDGQSLAMFVLCTTLGLMVYQLMSEVVNNPQVMSIIITYFGFFFKYRHQSTKSMI